MVKTATFFAMTLGAFVFWQSMDKVHVWIALHQDEKFEGVYSCATKLFSIKDQQQQQQHYPNAAKAPTYGGVRGSNVRSLIKHRETVSG